MRYERDINKLRFDFTTDNFIIRHAMTKNFEIVHLCTSPTGLRPTDYLQLGTGDGRHLLIVGEAPAPNGWRVSGRAFYAPNGHLLPTGMRLNELLSPLHLDIETVGFTELVKCFVGQNRSLLHGCGAKTWSLFLKQVKLTNPRLIIVLGKATHETFQHLYEQPLEFGKIVDINIAGKPRKLLSIYHPSPISPISRQHNKEIFSTVLQELEHLLLS